MARHPQASQAPLAFPPAAGLASAAAAGLAAAASAFPTASRHISQSHARPRAPLARNAHPSRQLAR